MDLAETKRRVAASLTHPMNRLPGIEVRLQPPQPEVFGEAALLELLDLLEVDHADRLTVGTYRFADDELPAEVFGPPQETLTLAPGTELDWHLWVVSRGDLRTLLERMCWPELIVDGKGNWLIWAEDLRSFLCDCRPLEDGT